jgi:hypothetical protein
VTRIVTRVHRPRRPARKRKPVAITGPAIVRRIAKADQDVKILDTSAKPPPANDDRKPAIVTTTSRKRARLLRAERAGDQSKIGEIDPEADARVKAFFDRMIRPR